MKRGVFDILRRALDNTLANWPLIAIRLAETIVFLICTAITVLAIFAPILVSLGINLAGMTSPDDLADVLLNLRGKWMLLIWAFLAISVLLFVFVAIHALVEAGSARVYVDAERIAGPALEGDRSRFSVFSMDRWWTGAREGWWPLFWIYNIAWTIASAFLLIPLLPTVAIMWSMQDANPGMAAGVGCLGLLATLLLLIVVGIVTTMWVNRAIAEWAVHRAGTRDALATGWREVRADFGRLVMLAIAIFVVALAGSSFFGSLSLFTSFASMSDSTAAMFFMLPVRILMSLVSSAFSGAMAAWFLASYASVAVERSAPPFREG